MIKIHAGALHILPVELIGESVGQTNALSLRSVLTDGGCGAVAGGRWEEMRFQSVSRV